jgi:hypothetical protein
MALKFASVKVGLVGTNSRRFVVCSQPTALCVCDYCVEFYRELRLTIFRFVITNDDVSVFPVIVFC